MTQVATLAVEDLVRRATEGDRESFAVLVRRHQPEIFRFFRRSCRTDEDARDQCQLAFLRAYRSLAGFEGRASFRTWLFRIATNLARNYHRDRARKPAVSLTMDSEGGSGTTGESTTGMGSCERAVPAKETSVPEQLARHEVRAQLRQAVEQLPTRQRAVVIWRIYHDLSFAEIAEVEEITANNAKVSYCHAVKKLRSSMAGAGNGVSP